METLITGAIVTLVGGIITYVIKGFFTGLEAKISDHKSETIAKFQEINRRIDTLNDGYGKIFNELLGKFSNWEDRIKGIMDELIKKQLSGSISDVADFAEMAFRDFDKKTKNELSSLKQDIEDLDKSIRTVEKIVTFTASEPSSGLSKEQLNTIKTHLKNMNSEIGKIQNNQIKGFEDIKDKITTLHLVCKSLNADCRRMDEKIRLISEETKQRIKLM